MKCISLLFVLIYFSNCISQIDYSFVIHLHKNKLINEQRYYINTLEKKGTSIDSVNYLYAKLFLEQQNDSLFFKYYSLSNRLFNKDSSALIFADYYYLKHSSTHYQNLWFTKFNTDTNNTLNSTIVSFYSEINNSNNIKTIPFINRKFNNQILRYNKLQKKNPTVAACLSAIVPGLGKLYGQRPNSALVTFFSQSLNAYQAFESIKKNGFKNGFSIFTISFFSFFYVSNIYGSYHDLISLKKQRKRQLLIDAEKYYHINNPVYLY